MGLPIWNENTRPLCRSAICRGYHGTSTTCCRVFSVVNFVPRVLAVAVTALSLWSLSGSADAQAPQRSVLRHLVGDVAVEGRTRGDGSMTLGVAGSPWVGGRTLHGLPPAPAQRP